MNFPILKKIPLFYGVKPEEIPSIQIGRAHV